MIATTIENQKLQDWRVKRLYCRFRLSVVFAIARGQFRRAWRCPEPQICRRNCYLSVISICHSSRDIGVSGLGATWPFPVVGHCCNHLATLYSGSSWSKNPGLAVGMSTVVFAIARVSFDALGVVQTPDLPLELSPVCHIYLS